MFGMCEKMPGASDQRRDQKAIRHRRREMRQVWRLSPELQIRGGRERIVAVQRGAAVLFDKSTLDSIVSDHRATYRMSRKTDMDVGLGGSIQEGCLETLGEKHGVV